MAVVPLHQVAAGEAFHLPQLRITGTVAYHGAGSSTVCVRGGRAQWSSGTLVIPGPVAVPTPTNKSEAVMSKAAKKAPAKKAPAKKAPAKKAPAKPAKTTAAQTEGRARKAGAIGPRWRIGLFRADSGKLSACYVTSEGTPMPYEQKRVGDRPLLVTGEYAGMRYAEARQKLVAAANAAGITDQPRGTESNKPEAVKKPAPAKKTAKKRAPARTAAKPRKTSKKVARR